jgi:hypothetical protein
MKPKASHQKVRDHRIGFGWCLKDGLRKCTHQRFWVSVRYRNGLSYTGRQAPTLPHRTPGLAALAREGQPGPVSLGCLAIAGT